MSEISDSYANWKPPARLSKRQRLVLENLRLVLSQVFRLRFRSGYSRFVPDHDDLTQEGMLGLLRAANWSGDAPTKFDPKKGRFSTYSVYWIRQHVWRALEQGGCGYGGARIAREKDLLQKSELLPVVDPPAPDAQETLERDEEIARLNAALEQLTQREADIVRRRWGLGGRKKETLKRLGWCYGISRERVRQIEKAAREKLRKLLAPEERP